MTTFIVYEKGNSKNACVSSNGNDFKKSIEDMLMENDVIVIAVYNDDMDLLAMFTWDDIAEEMVQSENKMLKHDEFEKLSKFIVDTINKYWHAS